MASNNSFKNHCREVAEQVRLLMVGKALIDGLQVTIVNTNKDYQTIKVFLDGRGKMTSSSRFHLSARIESWDKILLNISPKIEAKLENAYGDWWEKDYSRFSFSNMDDLRDFIIKYA